MVLCTVSKWRVVVGAKQLGFVIYLVLRMHQFQKYHLLWVIFDQWSKLDALSNLEWYLMNKLDWLTPQDV